jgi:hypothetical protein
LKVDWAVALKMAPKPTWRELIDACRPDQDDLQRSELAAELGSLARESRGDASLAAAMQQSAQFDRNVREALDDVPVPSGLMERLLARCEASVDMPVAEAATRAATRAETPAVAESHESVPTSETRPATWSRRRVLAVLSLAASLLVVLIGGLGYRAAFQKPTPVTMDQLAAKANHWFSQSGPAADWAAAKFPVEQFPFDRSVIVPPQKWRQLDGSTVAYDLTVVGGQRALLYVERTNRPHNIRNFPYTKLTSSGGVALGAWQRDGYVYVLVVVEDGGKSLGRFFRRGVGVI